MLVENPPAFPQSLNSEGPFGGMTLRDWVVGQALAGMCANSSMFDGCGTITQAAAQVAFIVDRATAVADAMLAERDAHKDTDHAN